MNENSVCHNPLKMGPFKIQTFLSRFQMVFDKMASICPNLKWLVGFPNFISHSKSFATQPLFDHSKSRLVRISDPRCNWTKNRNKAYQVSIVKHFLVLFLHLFFVNFRLFRIRFISWPFRFSFVHFLLLRTLTITILTPV